MLLHFRPGGSTPLSIGYKIAMGCQTFTLYTSRETVYKRDWCSNGYKEVIKKKKAMRYCTCGNVSAVETPKDHA